ncbi:uncharacterized protein EV422DRAFT_423641 [Fimicolochytrium jonesii]|uniref:uncharacterized protein n=1 Tax=Fimicolochytrium jonesii TaxID=1396493 RepID=UPI0022FEED62|nr:uncharacterized protein EV422DRAFT_423641 [Fimicolochytrium jonesii]KAI8821613.1 hypothetical protein EV422DRAFT_423641 [Fimicolochytrium jonesii]
MRVKRSRKASRSISSIREKSNVQSRSFATANTLRELSQQLGLCPDTIQRLVVKGGKAGYKKRVPFSVKREALPKAIATSKPANMNGWKVPPVGGPTPVTQPPITQVQDCKTARQDQVPDRHEGKWWTFPGTSGLFGVLFELLEEKVHWILCRILGLRCDWCTFS